MKVKLLVSMAKPIASDPAIERAEMKVVIKHKAVKGSHN